MPRKTARIEVSEERHEGEERALSDARKRVEELREQIKWVALAAAMAVLCNVIALMALAACGCDSSPIANVVLTAEGLIRRTANRRLRT